MQVGPRLQCLRQRQSGAQRKIAKLADRMVSSLGTQRFERQRIFLGNLDHQCKLAHAFNALGRGNQVLSVKSRNWQIGWFPHWAPSGSNGSAFSLAILTINASWPTPSMP